MSQIDNVETQTVAQIMRKNPVTVVGTNSIRDAVSIMSRHGIRHLVVVSPAGTIAGLLSQRDIFRHLSQMGDRNALVRSVMVTPVVSTHQDASVSEAAKILVESKIGCLPVLDNARTLVGVVTRSDLLSLVCT